MIHLFKGLAESMHAYNIIMTSKKNVWTSQEEQLLFSSHATMGSKWAAIAGRLPGKDQNAIKNKFYSTLRRGHRKINSYITDVKRRSDPLRNRACKTIHDIFISKLIAVVDRSHQEKYEVKPVALALATDIERMLIEVARGEEEYQQGHPGDYTMEEQLLEKILEFNKNCKKRKGKRNVNEKRKTVKSEEEIEQSEIITDSKIGEIKLEQKSQQLNVKTEEPIYTKGAQKLQPNIQFSSFLSGLQRKESTSTIINSFASMANLFKECYEFKLPQEESNLIQSANSMTHSSCLKDEKSGWMYESNSSQRSQPRRLPNYLTEPSPSPNDPFSPFTFSNIMKIKNITGSNMFQDKISCNEEELANSSLFQKDGLLATAIPKSGEFLVKSADLMREINQESPSLSSSMAIEKETFPTFSSIFPQIDEKHFANNRSFVNQYAFEPNNTPPLAIQSMFNTYSSEPKIAGV